jgi:hypothetical protein
VNGGGSHISQLPAVGLELVAGFLLTGGAKLLILF